MPEPVQVDASAEEIVRQTVLAADRRRYGRETARMLWRWAPRVTLGCAVIALVSRWMHWSLVVPATIFALAVVAGVLFVFVVRRPRPVSDAAAATIDAEAGFGGELRSAAWFAGRDGRDEWAEFHLEHAAMRLRAHDWAALYPPYRAARQRATTAALLAVIVALLISWPGRVQIVASAPVTKSAAPVVPEGAGMLTPVPDDLRKQIEDFLASVEKNAASAQQQTKTAAKLWNYMATFNLPDDPEALKKLAQMMDPTQKGSADEAAKKMLELADQANKAAEASSIPPELRKAMQDLGSQLSEAADAEQHSSEQASQQQNAAAAPQNGAAGEPSDGQLGDLDKSSIQFSKDNTASAGASMMIMSEQPGQRGGGSSSGYGGAGGPQGPKNGTMPDLALEQALRRETIEASSDTAGDNVMSETRHKTERTDATVAFTHGAAGGLTQGRAASPPPIPEDRRTVVETYFTRKQ
jgi:hypothetical protein